MMSGLLQRKGVCVGFKMTRACIKVETGCSFSEPEECRKTNWAWMTPRSVACMSQCVYPYSFHCRLFQRSHLGPLRTETLTPFCENFGRFSAKLSQQFFFTHSVSLRPHGELPPLTKLCRHISFSHYLFCF